MSAQPLNYNDRIKQLNKTLVAKQRETTKAETAKIAQRETALRQARVAPIIERKFAQFDTALASGNLKLAELYLRQTKKLAQWADGKTVKTATVRNTAGSIRSGLHTIVCNGVEFIASATECVRLYRVNVLGESNPPTDGIHVGRFIKSHPAFGLNFSKYQPALVAN